MYDLEISTFGRVKEDMRHSEAWEPWALRVPLPLKQIKADSGAGRGRQKWRKGTREKFPLLLSFLYRSYH